MTMKKEVVNWSALREDKLTDEDMNKIRGGDEFEDPNGPIIK
jgi:hypothetical protein